MWGKRSKNQDEKMFSFLSCLLFPFVCISNLLSSPKKPNKSDRKPHNPFEPNANPKTNPNPNLTPNSNPNRPYISFDVMIKRSQNSFTPPRPNNPNIIYGLDPMVHNRRTKQQKSKIWADKDLEGFAVAKKSSNPEKDFKESMVRMIRMKHIKRPEELENMLACYLLLNADEYQDLIVKVFRQIWFERERVSEPVRLNRRPVRANRKNSLNFV